MSFPVLRLRHRGAVTGLRGDVLVCASVGPAGELVAVWTAPEDRQAVTATTTVSAGRVSFPEPYRGPAGRRADHRAHTRSGVGHPDRGPGAGAHHGAAHAGREVPGGRGQVPVAARRPGPQRCPVRRRRSGHRGARARRRHRARPGHRRRRGVGRLLRRGHLRQLRLGSGRQRQPGRRARDHPVLPRPETRLALPPLQARPARRPSATAALSTSTAPPPGRATTPATRSCRSATTR